VGHASCNPIHFQRIQFTARKQWDIAFKHKHKIHQQKIAEYISNKDAASTEQMLEDPEIFKKQGNDP
jgi:hypothetical protein